MPLKPAQTKFLRGLAHDLKPIVHVGNKGLTDSLVAELETALEHHELVKLKIAAEDRVSRDALAVALAERTGAEKVQRIGHTLTLYRKSADKPKIQLPR